MHACWHHAPVASPSLPFNRCLNYYTQLFSSHTLNHPTVRTRTYKWYSAGFPNPSAPNKWNIIYTEVASLFAPTMPNPNPKPIDRPVALCASLHMVWPNISSPISLHPKIVWPFFRHPLLSHSSHRCEQLNSWTINIEHWSIWIDGRNLNIANKFNFLIFTRKKSSVHQIELPICVVSTQHSFAWESFVVRNKCMNIAVSINQHAMLGRALNLQGERTNRRRGEGKMQKWQRKMDISRTDLTNSCYQMLSNQHLLSIKSTYFCSFTSYSQSWVIRFKLFDIYISSRQCNVKMMIICCCWCCYWYECQWNTKI